jgi:hypothetical protein
MNKRNLERIAKTQVPPLRRKERGSGREDKNCGSLQKELDCASQIY